MAQRELSPVAGWMECRRLYGRLRLVIPWKWEGESVYQVTLDVDELARLCRLCKKNRGGSVRRGPMRIRRWRGCWNV